MVCFTNGYLYNYSRNPFKIILYQIIYLLKNILFLILLFLNSNLFSQNRNEFWSKVSLTKKINKHLAIGMNIQHRRQANFYKEDKNIFSFRLNKQYSGMGIL